MTIYRRGSWSLGAVFAIALTSGATAQDGAGAYLAARQAGLDKNFEAASRYFVQAMLENQGHLEIMEKGIAAQMAAGRVPQAISIAERLRASGGTSQVASMALAADDILTGNYREIFTSLESGHTVGPLVDGLLQAWAFIAEGKIDAAIDAFDEVADTEGLTGFALYHKALALASIGRFDAAEAVMTSETGQIIARSRRGAIARAQILSELDRDVEAAQLLTEVFGARRDPLVLRMQTTLAKGNGLSFDLIPTPRSGLAEVFFSVATALDGEMADDYTLLYTRTAAHIDPGHTDAILMSARLLDRLGQHGLATAAYDTITRDDPAFASAEMGRAEALRQSGQVEASIEVLRQLTETHGALPRVHALLGDTMRRLSRYDEAGRAYDRALNLMGDAAPWTILYYRGITKDRSGNWAEAEADLRAALDKNPDQPQVLNYLGYSLVEKNERLSEALDMIDRAARARPDAGHIIDSLGWALYRLGRVEEAVGQLERATELEPTDPTINDHLGDAYWSVGRAKEARFQWRRALSFKPEPELASELQQKIDRGLDFTGGAELDTVQRLAAERSSRDDG
ncbi:tetratricopeptide repeat protein [Aestuariibius insulae]|uniref:tetratricopeptide repeat protein n=1 Tax=Aestuariibius insulae TaxID=2058287 RepID=UPI00345EB585